MLWDYIKNNYSSGEPILCSDLNINMSEENKRQQLKKLADRGLLKRFEKGVYYIPSKSRLGIERELSPETLVSYKYIYRNNRVLGFYSGYTFANQLGITTQVPFVCEVITNEIGNPKKDITINGMSFVLRKARTEINENNVKLLQFLELLNNLDRYAELSFPEVKSLLAKYIRVNGFSKKEVDKYIKLFPDKIYKTIYETEIGNVFT